MKPTVILDTECYRNYWLAKFRNHATGNMKSFALRDGHPLDIEGMRKVLRQYRIVTFNGNNYDMVTTALALAGKSTADLKKASDMIIKTGLKPWHIEREFGVTIPKNINHIDIIEVAPGKASLKIYAGRLHCKKMQDLPIEPDANLTMQEMEDTDEYCGNDLQNTGSLFDAVKDQIELRERMTGMYGVDLRSKSDAQIAETVIKTKIEKATGRRLEKARFDAGDVFKYRRPSWISFETKQLQDVFTLICDSLYVLSDGGKLILPKEIKDADITIGESTYRIGIGGLHSTEEAKTHYSDDDCQLVDIDVDGYYPRLITNQKLYPPHLGEEFLEVYTAILVSRLAAKKTGDKVTDATLKIVLNGSFGKFGSKYSILFAPALLIQTTLTGQLALLMLIETLEANGIPLVSANTDGIVAKCPRKKIPLFNDLVKRWEARTNLTMSRTEYKSLHSANVNNYVAVKQTGGYKAKGAYAPISLMKNPTNEICSEAVGKLLSEGVSIEKTIRDCKDIRKFVTVRSVTGGAMWVQGTLPETKPTITEMKRVVSHHGWKPLDKMWTKSRSDAKPLADAYKSCFEVTGTSYLGKAIRWYYARNNESVMQYKLNGNKVPRSDGAKPLMELPDELPTDIDYQWYIDEAYSMLENAGTNINDLFGDLI